MGTPAIVATALDHFSDYLDDHGKHDYDEESLAGVRVELAAAYDWLYAAGRSDLRSWVVASTWEGEIVERTWEAEDEAHAREQALDAHPDEPIVSTRPGWRNANEES